MDGTVVTLQSIAPVEEWELMLRERMISCQAHPSAPLRIYNYTPHAQYSQTWNAITVAARGLIADADGVLVARPFPKFFNYDPVHGDDQGLDGPVEVTDKLDGSLGIGYPNPDTGLLDIATRGSFISEQALHATEVYRARYDGTWTPEPGFTYLWEIVYPENRIVVDYEGLDDLVLLGRVEIATGRSTPLSEITGWPGPRADLTRHQSLTDALEDRTRPNREGYVAHFTTTDRRVKIKQDDYVRIHRIVTGLTPLRVWEALVAGEDLDAWLQGTPEPFVAEVRAQVADIQSQRDELLNQSTDLLEQTRQQTGDGDRGAFARMLLRDTPDKRLTPVVFALLDGKRDAADKQLWKLVRPVATDP